MTVTSQTGVLPVNPEDHRAAGWWGMLLVIATEGAFFAYFIFSYFYLASMAHGQWTTGGAPSLTLVLPNTIVLLASSGTMWWGESGIRKGEQGRLRAGLLITFVLGCIFLTIQGIEYRDKPFTPATDAYASLFFTITGFHGVHVAVGLIMNAVVQVRAWLGHFSAKRHLAVSNVAAYWHFVDGVWVVVFISLYLSPRLG